MVNIDKMCSDLEECIGKDRYGKPEQLDINKLKKGGYTVQCAGLVVAAVKAQGSTVYNGSNSIWRDELTDSGYITDGKPSNPYPHKVNGRKSTQLEKGMVVFKWSPTGCSKAIHEKDGKGNYQHIGVVTSVNPLRIVHSSSSNNGIGITVDTKISTWCAWGKLKCVNYNTSTSEVV